MDEQLYTLDLSDLDSVDERHQQEALMSIEHGKVIFFPSYSFHLDSTEEKDLLTDRILDGKHKNISFDYRNQRLGGFDQKSLNADLKNTLSQFMQSYAEFSKQLVITTLPQYKDALIWGRTSYRPAEVKGRPSSKRKDDSRLHIDAFPATPVNGKRILRVFCNINPYGEPRVWHLGESFNQVIERFKPTISAYSRLRAKFLHWFKATKSLRSPYDHYQLHMHDNMKLDDNYQQTAKKQRIDFPAQSTWIVFTDQASHAALGGQFLLEQTFYLPVDAMASPELSPLKHWEREKNRLVV